MDSMELRERVLVWLREIGYTPVPIEEVHPQSVWRLAIDHPIHSETRIQVVGPKAQPDAVVVAIGTQMPHELRDSFERLSDEDKNDVLWSFRQCLNRVEVDFNLAGADGNLDFPKAIEITATRYSDGITKDTLHTTIGAVYKTLLKGMWLLRHRLGSEAFGSGGRFDFKKLGF